MSSVEAGVMSQTQGVLTTTPVKHYIVEIFNSFLLSRTVNLTIIFIACVWFTGNRDDMEYSFYNVLPL